MSTEMDAPMVQPNEDPLELGKSTKEKQSESEESAYNTQTGEPSKEPSERVNKVSKASIPSTLTAAKSTIPSGVSKRKIDINEPKSTPTKPTRSSALRTSEPVPSTRRSSTVGLPEKQLLYITKRDITGEKVRARSFSLTDTTFKFLLEQWKERLPSGYSLKKPFIDQPFEEDACYCYFEFVKDTAEANVSELKLKYQWFIGDRTASEFTAISDATREVYFPKRDDIGRILKVECTPVLGDTEYRAIFAISSLVYPGTGIPKVIKSNVHGELVEGNKIKGYAEVAWCGGTPGKGVASWLRMGRNGSAVVINGAEEEEYQLALDDIDSRLVYMYTPLTEEGAKGEPHYAITDYIKAAPPSVSNVRVLGDAIEGSTIRGVGDYFGGKQGPSKFEWLREDKETGEFSLFLPGIDKYTLTQEDVGRRLAFVYIPVNFEGQEGKSVSVKSKIIRAPPPKVTEVKIIGDLKEGNKISVSGILTGGTEASSTVEWFKSNSATLGGENDLKALSTSCIAMAYLIPLEAVGKFIVAKFTPMTEDEAGEPMSVISETAVTPLSPNLNYLSVSGDLREGVILTASYGYVGGHEGKSILNWYLHEVRNKLGNPITEFIGRRQYSIPKSAVGKFISFGCTPVRADGVSGEEKILFVGTPTACMVQRPELPRIETLTLTGKAVEGEVLTATASIRESEKYNVRYLWFSSSETGYDKFFERIPSQRSCSYKLCFEDIGRYLRCVSYVMDEFGRTGVLAYAETDVVLPGIPKIDKLEIEGRGFHNNIFSVRGTYSGGKEGNSRIQWFSSTVRSSDLTAIPGETGRTYEANVDDIGYSLSAFYTPISEDGIEGQCVSASTKPIAVEPAVLKEVNQKLNLRSVKFKIPGTASLHRRILEVNRKRFKVVKPGSKTSFPTTEIRGSYAPPFHVKLFRNDRHRLRIVVDGDHEVDLRVETPHQRDVIVLVIRGLAREFNSTYIRSWPVQPGPNNNSAP